MALDRPHSGVCRASSPKGSTSPASASAPCASGSASRRRPRPCPRPAPSLSVGSRRARLAGCLILPRLLAAATCRGSRGSSSRGRCRLRPCQRSSETKSRRRSGEPRRLLPLGRCLKGQNRRPRSARPRRSSPPPSRSSARPASSPSRGASGSGRSTSWRTQRPGHSRCRAARARRLRCNAPGSARTCRRLGPQSRRRRRSSAPRTRPGSPKATCRSPTSSSTRGCLGWRFRPPWRFLGRSHSPRSHPISPRPSTAVR